MAALASSEIPLNLTPNECIKQWSNGVKALKFGRSGTPMIRKYKLDEMDHMLKRRSKFKQFWRTNFISKTSGSPFRSQFIPFFIIACK
mmetsp:Transcript_20999/g.27310  ORF Transcript_20999/g.27310 Transcript_20999/m.27310 type:complete len:88 (+) Transcript_20999:17-280(+)